MAFKFAKSKLIGLAFESSYMPRSQKYKFKCV